MIEGKHGWNTLEDYLHVLERVVEDSPFVVSHTLTVNTSSEAGDMSGEIVCHGDIVVDVTKHFEIAERGGRLCARTLRYSYHARFQSGRDILRYDNAHAHQGAGHGTTHHKHTFEPGRETITALSDNDWPHLSDVLAELRRLVWR